MLLLGTAAVATVLLKHCTGLAQAPARAVHTAEDSLLALLHRANAALLVLLMLLLLLLLLPGAALVRRSQLSSSLFLHRAAALLTAAALPNRGLEHYVLHTAMVRLLLLKTSHCHAVFSLVLPPQSSFTDPPAE